MLLHTSISTCGRAKGCACDPLELLAGVPTVPSVPTVPTVPYILLLLAALLLHRGNHHYSSQKPLLALSLLINPTVAATITGQSFSITIITIITTITTITNIITPTCRPRCSHCFSRRLSVPRGEEGGALPQASLTPPGDGDDDDDGSVNGDDDGDYDGDDDGEPAGSSAGTGRPSSPSASGRQLSRNGPPIFARSATTRLKNGATGLCWVAMCQCSKMWCLVQSLVRFGINLVHNGYDMKCILFVVRKALPRPGWFSHFAQCRVKCKGEALQKNIRKFWCAIIAQL